MRNLACWLIILLHLQMNLPVESCEDVRDVFAMFGDEVTLQLSVAKEKQIRQVLWINSRGTHFATSRPGGSVVIREDSYTGRLRASSDGSLIIGDLQMNDAGIIKATALLLEEQSCSQSYNLSVTGKCGETKVLSAGVGRSVTLQVEESNIENLFWESPAGVTYAKTKRGGYLQEYQNKGRLLASQDGSLTITHLTGDDQRVYRAILLPRDRVGCMQQYQVTFTASLKGGSGAVSVISGLLSVVTLGPIYAWILV
ncbi:uncharacterized protein [Dendropsophus ebraccatus]|uniref:uncharacterized protein n=1 Tax=Dendropsophus ebraccatus TaxID=150705 RepID=UPI003831B555